MTKKIYKYSMPVQEKFSLELPVSAQIIRVEDVDGLFWMWAIVNTENETEVREFEMYKTGQAIDEPTETLRYLGLCKLFIMQELGLYVFERVKS